MQQLNLPNKIERNKHATKRQFGIALVEALVALVVLAFGVIGLLWMHQQGLIQQRQQLM